ncbi:hypothetical protein KP509_37G061700 [Ceratopteris richardii]|uniref:CREG-like beta-barrel domain-containing protein n=1 Tax=Ceratopteris richardii TaxID=49495 RepID=A0A8T2Q9N5_CERRI|nr:hypothetical protein KP509_37G061700 [Ceratopteris richardii]
MISNVGLHWQHSIASSQLDRLTSRKPFSRRSRLCVSPLALHEDDNGALPEPSAQVFQSVSLLQQDDQLSNSMSDIPGNTNRAGLFRTPISGGVQNATLSHHLPDPAVAVRNLLEHARFAHLSTIMSRMHHRRRGYPYGSFVDFAPDAQGHPIFSLSPLAIHTRNILADPRCSLLVQNPGWTGLANARVTLFGDVHRLSDEQQEWAHHHFMAKHQQAASQQWRNFDYFRMEVISDIYFIGGFGTVAWIDVNSYEQAEPDVIAKHGSEKILKDLNNTFSEHLRKALSSKFPVDDASFISIDSKGADVRVRQGAQYNVRRLSFCKEESVENFEQAKAALNFLLKNDADIFGNF